MNTGHQLTGVCRQRTEVYSVYLSEAANGWQLRAIVYSEFEHRLPLVSIYNTGFIPEADARRLTEALDHYAHSREGDDSFAVIINKARSVVVLSAPVYMVRADIDKEWRS